jgi:hypothetical protein
MYLDSLVYDDQGDILGLLCVLHLFGLVELSVVTHTL